jgi:hypothetical protein
LIVIIDLTTTHIIVYDYHENPPLYDTFILIIVSFIIVR